MSSLDLFVSTAVCTAESSDFAFRAVVNPPKITPEKADQVIKKQQALVAAGARANMREVAIRAATDCHFKSVQRNSLAVGFLVDAMYTPQNAGDGELREPALSIYGNAMKLDPRDMLFAEPLWPDAFGTCFLTCDDVVVTAKHVFCNDTRAMCALTEGRLLAVFGFEVAPNGQTANLFREHVQVFAVKPRTIDCPLAPVAAADDWVKLVLAEPATRGGIRSPLVVSTDPLAINTPVYTLGHPNGASLRYVHTSAQLDRHADSFSAFLDAYDNSSGSPVFSADDHRVVGLIKFSYQSGGRYRVDEGAAVSRHISQLCLPGESQATLCVNSAAFYP